MSQSPADDSTLPRWQRQRQQQIKLIGALVGSIAVLTAVAIIVLSMGGGDKNGRGGPAGQASSEAGRRSGAAKSPALSPEALEKLEGVIPLDELEKRKPKNIAEILGVKPAKPDAPPEEGLAEPPADEREKTPTEKQAEPPPKKKPEKPPLDPSWMDASGYAAVVGFVSVRIVSAVAVPPRDAAAPSSGHMLITVEVRNAGAREVDFKGWARGDARRGAKLIDDAGNECPPRALEREAPAGQGPPMSIAPGRSGRETLAFELPPDEVDYVLIELPASAFGMKGVVRMKIPAPMIAEQPETDEPPGPRPGTPEFDFGIPETDEDFEER